MAGIRESVAGVCLIMSVIISRYIYRVTVLPASDSQAMNDNICRGPIVQSTYNHLIVTVPCFTGRGMNEQIDRGPSMGD
jgi:hypothetical protein